MGEKIKLTDADVMKGGLDDDVGKGAADDKGKKAAADDGKGGGDAPKTVMVGGVEFPAELGDKLQTLVQGFSKEIDHLKGQVHTLSTVSKAADDGKKSKDDDDDLADIDTKLFTDPKGTINKILGKFKKEIEGLIAESTSKVESKVQATSQEKEFWSAFYADNPELKEHDFIARAILNRDFAKLGSGTVEAAMKHIATETKKLLLKAGNGSAGSGKSRDVEGAGGRPAGGAKDDGKGGDKDGGVPPETLSEFIKARRAARRGGAASKSA